MALQSSIEWTESTWNPVTGCTKTSAGCANCYAERMARRLQAMGQPNYARGFEVTTHPEMLELPLQWRKPQTIFVNSMSDLFHEAIPAAFIRRVFRVMNQASWHRFQILTKRATRLADLDLTDIDWIITGGESGPGARPMQEQWVTDIRDQCIAAGVPFFFKQWGGLHKKKAGRELDGRLWSEMPASSRATEAMNA